MSTPIIVDEDEPEYDLDEPPFEPRDVTLRKDKWVTDEFDIHDFLGRGKFGEVKRCTEKSTGREFAAKFISAPRPQDKKDVEHELNIMKKLYHKRLIQLYDAFESKVEMCLVLEIIYGGELFDRVISDDFILTEKACVAFIRQICEGLEYMHHKMIIHLDMKPENILCLTRTGNRIKIIDFGLAREYHPKKDLRVLFGTPEFMAPEVVQYETISFGTDMWSVGVICYVLLSGLSPFMGDTDADTLSNVIKSQFDFNYTEFDEVSDEAKDLISRLLVKDKNKRLTASECLSHPWLALPGRTSEATSPNLRLSKKRLKRFVYRRKWQKIVNAIIALRRMGFQLMALQKSQLAQLSNKDVFNANEVKSDNIGEPEVKSDDIQRSLEVKGYEVDKRKASDSGYESVAVDKDTHRDFDGTSSEGDVTSSRDVCVSSVNINLDTSARTLLKEGAAEAGQTPVVNLQISEAKLTLAPSPKQQELRDKAKGDSRGSSKDPPPSQSSKKPSIIDRFGGLFLSYKDSDGTPPKRSSKKGSTKKGKDKEKDAKDKPSGGIVKKDSFKRKVGPKGKEEVYVTTPVVRQKHPNFHHVGNSDSTIDASHDQSADADARKSPAVDGTPKCNSELRKEALTANGGPRNHEVRSTSPPDGGAVNGSGARTESSPSADEEKRTPSILFGNVRNKRKLFENNGRAS